MNEPGTQHMSVQHQLLRVLRVVWVGLALIVVWAVVRGAAARFLELITVSEDAAQFVGQLTPADASQLATWGLAARQYAAYFTIAETATALIFIAMAWLIFLRRPRDWFALYVATFFCLASVVLPIGSALQRSGILDPMVLRSIQLGFSFCFVAFPFLFPDGTPVPRWSLGVIVVSLVYCVVGMAVPALLPPTAFGAGLTTDQVGPLVWLIGLFALGVAAQSYRYRSVATATQRQQTKWIVYGLCACLGLALLGIIVVNASSIPDGRVNYMALRIAGPTLILAGAALIPLTIGFSVLRYRLWPDLFRCNCAAPGLVRPAGGCGAIHVGRGDLDPGHRHAVQASASPHPGRHRPALLPQEVRRAAGAGPVRPHRARRNLPGRAAVGVGARGG